MDFIVNRSIDELGRLVLPIEYRRILEWNDKDSIDIILEKNLNRVILKKSTPSCDLCGSGIELIQMKNKYICRECRQRILSVSSGDV